MILSAIHYLAGQILKKWCLRGQNLRSNKTYLKIKMGFCKFRFWLGQLVFSAGNIIQPALRSTWQIKKLEWIMRHALQVPLHDMYNVRFNRHKITNESCTWPCRRDTNWFWIMRCFLQVPLYNLHCAMFSSKLGQWCLLQVLNVKWGQGCLLQVPWYNLDNIAPKEAFKQLPPWIQTRKSNAKKWTKRKGNHIWNVWTGHSLKWLLTHGFISVLGSMNFRSQLGHETACTAQY